MGEERAEALPRHAVEADEDAVVGKAGMAISAGDLARQHRPDRPVDVADFPLDPDRLAVLQRGSRRLDQLLVKRRSQAMVLTFRVVQRDRKSGVEGKSVSVRVNLGGRRTIKKKKKTKKR